MSNTHTRGSALSAFGLDILAIVIFALLARLAHNNDSGLTLTGWAHTAWPFLLGVIIVWGALWFNLLGARGGYEFSVGAIVWFVTVVTGLVIWSIRNSAVPHWSFILVATTMSAVLLFGWRGITRTFNN